MNPVMDKDDNLLVSVGTQWIKNQLRDRIYNMMKKQVMIVFGKTLLARGESI